ncbi:MAG: zinc ribbon domain-containing protein [Promethearchaeota archaeon]
MGKNMQSTCPACGITIKIGQKFCTSCGAKLSEKNVIATSSGTSGAQTQMAIIDKDWETLKQLIEQKNKNEILKFLEKHLLNLSYYNDASRKKVYDLIGQMQTENPQFFMQKIFAKLYKKTDNLLSPQQKFEMDIYILEKCSFFKGEELITSSKGKVIEFGKLIFLEHEIRGRFYVTNQRIIAHGQIRRKTMTSLARGPEGYGGMEFPYMDGIRIWTARGAKDNILPYGVSRNLILVTQIKRKEKSIQFNLEFKYEQKGKTKKATAKIGIEPLKEEYENKIDFQRRRETVLLKINELLNSNFQKM